MTYDDLIAHFKAPSAAAKARGIDRQVVFGWKRSGRVPLDQQIEFERITRGALRADLSDETRAVICQGLPAECGHCGSAVALAEG